MAIVDRAAIPEPQPGPFFAQKSRMLCTLGVLLFAGFLLTGIISYLISRSSIRKAILQDELPLSSDNIYSEIQRDLFQPILISSLMANDTFVRDWIRDGEQNPDLIIKYLRQIQEKYGTITSFLVSEKTRNYYHSKSVLKHVQEDNPADAWFFRVRAMEPDYEINVDPDMANRDTMTIFINYRILDKSGNFLGATGVGLTVNAVKALMQEYRTRYHRDIYFYNRRGELVLHSLEPDKEDSLTNHNAEEALHSMLTRINVGETKATISAVGKGGAMANYRYIPELDWVLVVEQTSDGTRGILLQSFAFNLLVCLITSIILLSIIRLTVLRYQANLETRNLQLQEKNARIEEQADELREANKKLDALHREKDELIGITVHDLKNPLHSVLGFSELLYQNELPPDEVREHAGDIYASSWSMLEQVESLLKLTELDDPTVLRLEPLDMSEIVRETLQSYEHQSRQKCVSVMLDLPPMPLTVQANKDWLMSSLGNLISNAIKYSPPGGNIEVSVRRQNMRVEFSVKDQGEGLSTVEKKRLFRKFERLSPRPTAGESSTGLGLYLVHQMVSRMGGEVSCESQPGRGSTFTISFDQ